MAPRNYELYAFVSDLVNNVVAWGRDRGIYEGSLHTQTMKFVAEIGELADAVIAEDTKEMQDAIGDCMCVLCSVFLMSKYPHTETEVASLILTPYKHTNYSSSDIFALISGAIQFVATNPAITLTYLQEITRILGFDFIECFSSAYDVIKNRKGKTLANGNFVKDTVDQVEPVTSEKAADEATK